MSYREYSTASGGLSHRSHNGHRFTPDPRDILHPVRPGDGPIFKRYALAALQTLVDDIGEREYKAWWERSFEQDGKTADDFTWQEVMIAAQLALEHPETLECSCNGVTQPCEVCKSIAHVSTVPEFES